MAAITRELTGNGQSELDELRDSYESQLALLAESIDALHGRLTPVIRPVPLKDDAGSGVQVPVRSPHGCWLEQRKEQLQAMHRRVNDILTTLAV